MLGIIRSSWRSLALRGLALLGLMSAVTGLPNANAAEDSCPLTAGQKTAAVKAFKGLAPVFQEPRCLNCHGTVNPFSRTGGHGGGYIDIRKEAKDFLDSPAGKSLATAASGPGGSFEATAIADIQAIAGSATEISDRDLIMQKAPVVAIEEICGECHSRAWRIPQSRDYFVNKDWKAMCVHMKTRFPDDEASFLIHFQEDELIREGFEGRRGLLEVVAPEPPAISRATVTKYANDWVAAMGGRIPEPVDCGCKTDDIVLEIQHHIQSDPKSARSKVGSAQFDGTVKFEVGLTHREKTPEGWFYGEATVTRPWVVRHVVPSFLKCSGSGSENETWHFFARVDPATDTMQVQFGYRSSDEKVSWTCTGLGVSITDPLYIDVFSSLESVAMPVSSGAKKDLNGRRESSFEQLSVTVLDSLSDK
jgi:hypothetical protein